MWILYVILAILAIGVMASAVKYIYEEKSECTPEPETGFDSLLEKVRVVDEDAARWLESGDKSSLTFFGRFDTLRKCFLWEEAPQGVCYWADISAKIRSL